MRFIFLPLTAAALLGTTPSFAQSTNQVVANSVPEGVTHGDTRILDGTKYCRLVSGAMVCATPTPPSPATPAQLEALKAQFIADERAIFSKLGTDLSPENCGAAQTLAKTKGRGSLADAIKVRCGAARNSQTEGK